MKLALEAFHKGSFTSKTACATTFNVPKRAFMTCLNGTTSCREMPANGQKLSDLEEETLSRWILSMDQRGLPIQISNVHHLAWLLLSAQSKPCKSTSIGERWVSQFIKHHPELKSKYTHQYDHQHAKCEDPELIKGWYNHIQETIQKYGILEQDIYNMKETGF